MFLLSVQAHCLCTGVWHGYLAVCGVQMGNSDAQELELEGIMGNSSWMLES